MAEVAVPNHDDLLLDSLDLVTPSQVNRSGWTGRGKVIGLPGAEMWRGKATIDSLATEVQERPWRAFLYGLGGSLNWFRWPLPCQHHIGPRPVVGTSPGNGYTLPLTGMQPSTLILRAGQHMTVPLPSGHSRTVVLLAELRTDALGKATASFRPALGEVPTVGATVETGYPFIPVRPASATLGLTSADGISGTSFDVEEAL